MEKATDPGHKMASVKTSVFAYNSVANSKEKSELAVIIKSPSKIRFELKNAEGSDVIACQPMQVAGDTVALFAQLASVKGLALDCHWRGAPPPVYDIDAVRLRQMLSNFISNAIKFTASGFVRVEARELESRDHQALVEFAVIDSGIGIAPDKRDLLFQPFSQADSGVSRRYGGTGLGLSIVGRLAALMGGTAGFESEPGKGSRFWFRIRADVLAPGAQAIASAASWD